MIGLWSERWYRIQVWMLHLLYPRSYLRFYRHLMRLRASRDPRAAVGGMWDELGELQMSTLRRLGLLPGHTLLDIGCGALRGGGHFMAYLNQGNYTGIDISPDIIAAGRNLLNPGLIEQRRPRLLVNNDLLFSEFAGCEFDFAFAQSVFTHMPAEHIEECLRHLPRVMRDAGRFCFTVFLADAERYEPVAENFYYRRSLIERLATLSGWTLSEVVDFAHPRGQSLFMATLAENGGLRDGCA